MKLRDFWIRKDREQYFLSGVIMTCVIGAFVSSYWHFTDRISVRRDIKINKWRAPEDQQRTLKEVQFTPAKLKVGGTQYYRLEEDTAPSVPALGEDD